jgi:hypothetical protein
MSATEHGGLVYVLNTAGPSLAGFRLSDGGLEPVTGASRAPALLGALRKGVWFRRAGARARNG